MPHISSCESGCHCEQNLKLVWSGLHVRGAGICPICRCPIQVVEEPGRMPFGRFRGLPIRLVPRDYLIWARKASEIWSRLSEERRDHIAETLGTDVR